MDKVLRHHLKFVLNRYIGGKNTYVYASDEWLYVTDSYVCVRIPLCTSPFSVEGLLTNVYMRYISMAEAGTFVPPCETSQMTELEDTGKRQVIDDETEAKVLIAGGKKVLLPTLGLRQLAPRGVLVRYWKALARPSALVYLTFGGRKAVRAVIMPIVKGGK